MNDNDRLFNNTNESTHQAARQRQPASKRARLVDFYNNTRSSYIPSIASSISGLVISQDDNTQLPNSSKIFMYDTYTVNNDGTYTVEIHGYLYCPGTMTRKNRLLLTLARQLTKPSLSSQQIADHFQGEIGDKLNNPDQYNDTDEESVYSTESSASSAVSINTDNILKERLQGFMTRSLPQQELRVVVGSELKIPVEELSQLQVMTHDNGHFQLVLETKYKPSIVQVTAMLNDEIVNFKEVNIIDNKSKVSIISDIDDTVKLTGVVNDKRDMFRNVFTKEYNDLEIPGFVNWFTLASSKDCKIHYVSNSPWQLLKTIENYFQAIGLPYDSIHLKQYSGNVIALLMEPSSERKKPTLMKIVSDFSQRKFILIGDTGERDLEAYLSLAKLFPSQILMIYMRIVPGSLSDDGDKYVHETITKLLQIRDRARNGHSKDLIDLTTDLLENAPRQQAKLKQKLSPIIPKKPSSLKGQTLPHSESTEEVAPKLPPRRAQTVETGSLPNSGGTTPEVPQHSHSASGHFTTAELDSSHLTANSVYDLTNVMTHLDIDDRKGDIWRERMIRVLNELPDEVGIRFFKDTHEVVEESLSIINRFQ